MRAPDGLEVLREYSCGCIVYRRYDSTVSRWVESDEKGLFCDPDWLYSNHKQTLTQGAESQPRLFAESLF